MIQKKINKIISQVLLMSLFCAHGICEEEFYSDEIYNTFEVPYSDPTTELIDDDYALEDADTNPDCYKKPRYERPGSCYYDCRGAACYVTALILGVAVIAGLVAIVVHESHCSHAH